MGKIPIDVTGVRATALLELYFKSLDSKDPRPILRDPWAAKVVERLDFDFEQFRTFPSGQWAVGVRSRVMDDWISAYLAASPDAVVLDLGCGFDSRVFRVDPAPGHHWYDVDFPDMVKIAEQLYPERRDHTRVGVSVVDPDWLASIPGDRPVAVVADGLFGFLTEEEVRRVFRQIVEHFPRGEIGFNTYSSLVKKREKKRPAGMVKHNITIEWTLDHERDVEKFHERLRLVEEKSQVESPLLASAPLYYRLLCALICLSDKGKYSTRILRYRF